MCSSMKLCGLPLVVETLRDRWVDDKYKSKNVSLFVNLRLAGMRMCVCVCVTCVLA